MPQGSLLDLPLQLIYPGTYDTDAFLARLHDDGVPVGPTLSISPPQSAGYMVSWPVVQDRFVLECASSLGANAAWSQVAEKPVIIGDQNVLSFSADQPATYYRLRVSQ